MLKSLLISLLKHVFFKSASKKAKVAKYAIEYGPQAFRLINKAKSKFMDSNAQSKLPRNVRNNNPLNIRNSQDKWVGKAGTDGEFVIFSAPEFGFRAAYKLVGTYQNKYKLTTVEQIIQRWAPKTENDTQRYVKYVCNRANLNPNQEIGPQECEKLLLAMAEFEGGGDFFTLEQVKKGIELI